MHTSQESDLRQSSAIQATIDHLNGLLRAPESLRSDPLYGQAWCDKGNELSKLERQNKEEVENRAARQGGFSGMCYTEIEKFRFSSVDQRVEAFLEARGVVLDKLVSERAIAMETEPSAARSSRLQKEIERYEYVAHTQDGIDSDEEYRAALKCVSDHYSGLVRGVEQGATDLKRNRPGLERTADDRIIRAKEHGRIRIPQFRQRLKGEAQSRLEQARREYDLTCLLPLTTSIKSDQVSPRDPESNILTNAFEKSAHSNPLLSIAIQLRQLPLLLKPGRTDSWLNVGTLGGRLLLDAIDAGAFAHSKWATFLHFVHAARRGELSHQLGRELGGRNPNGSLSPPAEWHAFVNGFGAAKRLRGEGGERPFSDALLREACELFAELIEVEANTGANAAKVGAVAKSSAPSLKIEDWAGSDGVVAAAIVFTDIVDSKGLWQRFGGVVSDKIRAQHLVNARMHVERHAGYYVKNMGDAVYALFRNAGQALRFILALQSDGGHPDLRIRAVAHVGHVTISVEEQDGFGPDVDLVGSIIKVIDGQAVLVTSSVKEFVEQRRELGPIAWREVTDFSVPNIGFQGLWQVA